MCIWDFCCKCLEDENAAAASRQSSDGEAHGAAAATSPNPPICNETELIVFPVTPPRTNRSNKIEVARKLNEEIGRQISALSDESPEVLKKQSAAFRALQSEAKCGTRKRNISSPGKLESHEETSNIDCIAPSENILEITECLPHVENVQIEKELVQNAATDEKDTDNEPVIDEHPESISSLSLREAAEHQSPLSLEEDPFFQINNRPFLDNKPEVYLSTESVPEQASSKSRSSPDIRSPDAPSDSDEEMRDLLSKGGSKIRGAFSRGSRDNKRYDPKKQVRNVHKLEQREAALKSDVLKNKHHHKTKSFKRKVQGPHSPGSSRSSSSDVNKLALLATAGLLLAADVPDPTHEDYERFVQQQIAQNSAFLEKHYEERSDATGRSNKQPGNIEQQLYNTRHINEGQTSRTSASVGDSVVTSTDTLIVNPTSSSVGGLETLPTVSIIKQANGQTVTNVDRRGIIRGPCTMCKDCEQYEVENSLSCDYCGCPPGKHQNNGYFNQHALSQTMSKPVVKTLQADINLAPPQKSQHGSYLTESPVQSPALARKEVVQQSQQQSSAASRKPLSVADVTALPESWTLENAINFLTLERADSTEFDTPAHFSTPNLNYDSKERVASKMSGVSDYSDYSSGGNLDALYKYNNSTAYDKRRTDTTQSQMYNQHQTNDDNEDEFEISDITDAGIHDLDYMNSPSASGTLTLQQAVDEEPCQIIQLNGGDIIRGVIKEEIQLKVDIIPRSIKKQHVQWFFNNKKITPRYRVRFVNERREVHFLSLRKKDAGVYKCQIKYTQGRETYKTACTMIMDVQVPHFVAKDL